MADQPKTIDGFKVPALPSRLTKPQFPALSYAEPSNSGYPQHDYTLEVIKNGAQAEFHEIPGTKSYVTFGRLPVCDYPMDHESVSRYHAVLQFFDDGSAGIVDLGSSHGTFINKQRTAVWAPVQVRTGDQIRFGMSSRIWILGSSHTEEDAVESEQVPEKQQQRQQQQKIADGAGKHSDPVQRLRKFLRKTVDTDEYTWEVTADDVTQQNTAAISLELTDADGDKIAATARASSGPEAERQAAKQILEQLDEHGYLRRRRSAKPVEIDSDDVDEYYDHTKPAEESRHLELSEVESHQSLLHKIDLVSRDIAAAQRELAQIPEAADNNDGLDELDVYMSNLNRSEQQTSRKRISEQIARLELHRQKLDSLVKIVAPEAAPSQLSRSHDIPKVAKEPALANPASTTGEPAIDVPAITGSATDKPAINAPVITEPVADEPIADEPTAEKPVEPANGKRKRVFGPTREEMEQRSATKHAKHVNSPNSDQDTTWQPPSGQTGDGKTALNDKYGY
ncbi:hypothetical protein IWW52_004174 [Coemansia sp. RSA 2704]|nr:hypothetical protein IWW52_004174 [Coemansia sp. RSA 2704]